MAHSFIFYLESVMTIASTHPIEMSEENLRMLLTAYIVNDGNTGYLKNIQAGLSLDNQLTKFLEFVDGIAKRDESNIPECIQSLVIGLTLPPEQEPLVKDSRLKDDLLNTTYYRWLKNLRERPLSPRGFVPLLVRLYQLRLYAMRHDQTEVLKANNAISIAVAAIVDAYRKDGEFLNTTTTGYHHFIIDLWQHAEFDLKHPYTPQVSVNSEQWEEWLSATGAQDVIWMKLQETVLMSDEALQAILTPLYETTQPVIEQQLFPTAWPGALEKLLNTCVTSHLIKYIASHTPSDKTFPILGDVEIVGNHFKIGNAFEFEFIGVWSKAFYNSHSGEQWTEAEIEFHDVSTIDQKVIHKHIHAPKDAIIVIPVIGCYDDFYPMSEIVSDEPRRFYAFFRAVK